MVLFASLSGTFTFGTQLATISDENLMFFLTQLMHLTWWPSFETRSCTFPKSVVCQIAHHFQHSTTWSCFFITLVHQSPCYITCIDLSCRRQRKNRMQDLHIWWLVNTLATPKSRTVQRGALSWQERPTWAKPYHHKKGPRVVLVWNILRAFLSTLKFLCEPFYKRYQRWKLRFCGENCAVMWAEQTRSREAAWSEATSAERREAGGWGMGWPFSNHRVGSHSRGVIRRVHYYPSSLVRPNWCSRNRNAMHVPPCKAVLLDPSLAWAAQ